MYAVRGWAVEGVGLGVVCGGLSVLVDEFIDWLMEGLMNGLVDIGD